MLSLGLDEPQIEHTSTWAACLDKHTMHVHFWARPSVRLRRDERLRMVDDAFVPGLWLACCVNETGEEERVEAGDMDAPRLDEAALMFLIVRLRMSSFN